MDHIIEKVKVKVESDWNLKNNLRQDFSEILILHIKMHISEYVELSKKEMIQPIGTKYKYTLTSVSNWYSQLPKKIRGFGNSPKKYADTYLLISICLFKIYSEDLETEFTYINLDKKECICLSIDDFFDLLYKHESKPRGIHLPPSTKIEDIINDNEKLTWYFFGMDDVEISPQILKMLCQKWTIHGNMRNSSFSTTFLSNIAKEIATKAQETPVFSRLLRTKAMPSHDEIISLLQASVKIDLGQTENEYVSIELPIKALGEDIFAEARRMAGTTELFTELDILLVWKYISKIAENTSNHSADFLYIKEIFNNKKITVPGETRDESLAKKVEIAIDEEDYSETKYLNDNIDEMLYLMTQSRLLEYTTAHASLKFVSKPYRLWIQGWWDAKKINDNGHRQYAINQFMNYFDKRFADVESSTNSQGFTMIEASKVEDHVVYFITLLNHMNQNFRDAIIHALLDRVNNFEVNERKKRVGIIYILSFALISEIPMFAETRAKVLQAAFGEVKYPFQIVLIKNMLLSDSSQFYKISIERAKEIALTVDNGMINDPFYYFYWASIKPTNIPLDEMCNNTDNLLDYCLEMEKKTWEQEAYNSYTQQQHNISLDDIPSEAMDKFYEILNAYSRMMKAQLSSALVSCDGLSYQADNNNTGEEKYWNIDIPSYPSTETAKIMFAHVNLAYALADILFNYRILVERLNDDKELLDFIIASCVWSDLTQRVMSKSYNSESIKKHCMLICGSYRLLSCLTDPSKPVVRLSDNARNRYQEYLWGEFLASGSKRYAVLVAVLLGFTDYDEMNVNSKPTGISPATVRHGVGDGYDESMFFNYDYISQHHVRLKQKG